MEVEEEGVWIRRIRGDEEG